MNRDAENRPFAKPENVTFKRQKQFQASIYNDYTSIFMRRLLFIFSLLFFTKTSFSQDYLNYDKATAKRYLHKYTVRQKVQTKMEETDTTLSFFVRDTSKQNLDFLLHYDQSGMCDKEESILSCDSCFKKILNETLSVKRFRWAKVNDNCYFSKYSKRLVLTIQNDVPFSYRIERNKISKQEFEQLINIP